MENGSLLRIPLYVQVREKLREELTTSEAGTMIPPEAMLEQRFQVSRITIRKAIDDLVGEGLLVRKQGRGTFRDVPKVAPERIGITSWTAQMEALGYVPGTSEREVTEIAPPKKIAHLLALGTDERVVQVRRTRTANGQPVTLMVNYIPSSLLPGFEALNQGDESLYKTIRSRHGLSPAEAADTIETRQASEAESEKLQIEPWAPVLVVTRIAWLADGRPFEVGVAVSCGDRYEYRVHMHGAPLSITTVDS